MPDTGLTFEMLGRSRARQTMEQVLAIVNKTKFVRS